jgi:hypothetical protein
MPHICLLLIHLKLVVRGNYHIKLANICLENVARFMSLGTTLVT